MAHDYTNDAGGSGQLTGKTAVPTNVAMADSFVSARHPDRSLIVGAERKARASYIGTLSALRSYLVPHRFEGTKEPDRARLGYGLKLNASYLEEIFGHVRSAPARYNWGPLTEDQGDAIIAPKSGLAKLLWDDATRKGENWRDFFEGTVLEWLLSSLGGVVIVDAPSLPADLQGVQLSQADVDRLGIRPYLQFRPFSDILDCGHGEYGLTWVQFEEVVDRRTARERKAGWESQYLIFELGEGGRVTVQRFSEEGTPIDAATELGAFVDPAGRPMMNMIEAKFGTHPDVGWVGTGLLLGLDDIIIDLYNVLSETREGYRDAAFGFLAYAGPDGKRVLELIKDGSRFVPLGADPGARLDRISGDATEVQAGKDLIAFGLQAWAYSARRNAAKAMEGGAQGQSGVSLQAEFALDLKPLLVKVTETLDAIETNVMYVVGLQAGFSPEALAEVGVRRDTEFRLEDEDTRISRKVEEFTKSLPLTPILQEEITVAWAEATRLFDMNAPVEIEVTDKPGGIDDAGQVIQPVTRTETKTFRDQLRDEAREEAESGKMAKRQAEQFLPADAGMGAPGIPFGNE
jgi:hypothetical protein